MCITKKPPISQWLFNGLDSAYRAEAILPTIIVMAIEADTNPLLVRALFSAVVALVIFHPFLCLYGVFVLS